ncbi:hypothetical protein COP2_022057 [Malus domestica]
MTSLQGRSLLWKVKSRNSHIHHTYCSSWALGMSYSNRSLFIHQIDLLHRLSPLYFANCSNLKLTDFVQEIIISWMFVNWNNVPTAKIKF